MKCYFWEKQSRREKHWAIVVEKDSDYAESWKEFNNGVAWCLIFWTDRENTQLTVGYRQVWIEGNEIRDYDLDIPIETKRKAFPMLFWGKM